MSKLNPISIPLGTSVDNWKLVREGDRLVRIANNIIWVEFNEEGTFKEKYDEIGLNRSLVMSPFNQYFTWQTTLVTEILDQKEDYIKFKTENSIYELSGFNRNSVLIKISTLKLRSRKIFNFRTKPTQPPRRSKQLFRGKNPFVMRMTLTVLNYEVWRNRIANFN
jgi:hypothetical protein